jgi:hypothetical protein
VLTFSQLIRFLDGNIYSGFPSLLGEMPDGFSSSEVVEVEHEIDYLQICSQYMNLFFLAKVLLGQSGGLPEDLALKFQLNSILSPSTRNWALVLSGLKINEEGQYFWAADFGLGAQSDISSYASSSSVLSQEGGMEAHSAVRARRGRPRKQEAPQVESQVKRSLRRNSQGYNYEMLPYQPSRCKTSKVTTTSTPAVLQIEEMQRIGVEECDIEPAALTEERLLQQREVQE